MNKSRTDVNILKEQILLECRPGGVDRLRKVVFKRDSSRMTNDLRQRRQSEDQSSTSPLPSESIHPKAGRWKTIGWSLLVVGLLPLLSIFIFREFHRFQSLFIDDSMLDDQFYPAEILHLFKKYDRDENHHLSLDEFEPLAMQMLNKHRPIDYQQPILDVDQFVTIDAFFEPLNLSTMTKDFRHTFIVGMFSLSSLLTVCFVC
jgi:hypothetical protein